MGQTTEEQHQKNIAATAKRLALLARVPIKRGKLFLTPEEKMSVKGSLKNIWQLVGSDVEEAFHAEYPKKDMPQSGIREVVVDQSDSYAMDYFTLSGARRREQSPELTPTLEYLFTYPYMEECRGILTKIAKEINF